VQPVGITTIILDQNNLLPMLGAAASQNNILPVQVLESGAFLSVGTVVSPVVSAKYGTTNFARKIDLRKRNRSPRGLEIRQP
jgi:hypothetical protein